ncbi:YecA family protein [Sansalvadorimonas sp. 2012CJ34-2]|uniref:YecA family protein n=1 Tax=Parendozoicomonas callyspongiae TaxID=2942213 RepID=A0ABT0PM05_9GAMM|nr:YecA family protein [Sansalvadorimonas sp. 2012CJ34-2]MCL6271483.1 YecA family protein [Sansalvadorimonas sp. 2012CJ34-2]
MTDSDLLLDGRLFQALDKVADKDEEALDAIMGHGYLTAQAISPQPDSAEDICQTMFPDIAVTGLTQEQLVSDILAAMAEIDNQLNDEVMIPVSVEEDEDILESELADWCAGFMEAHIEQEELWLNNAKEQEIAELLLPVAALSGLFVEEEEFSEISGNPDLLEDMATQLPEVLVELYLMIRTD